MQSEQNISTGWSGREWALASLMMLAVVVSSITTLDRHAEADYEALFQRAFITFALARTLNGVISAVQGTEIALQPAGVGVTLTPGEILDPVNDLVERFSWIMLGATLSLGIQQVLMDVGQWWFMRVLVALAGILWLWARVSRANTGTTEQTLLKVFFIVLFLRFAVPVALIANELLFELFLEPRYLESTQVIETAGAEIEQVGTNAVSEEETEPSSLMQSLERALDSTRETLDLKHRVDYIKQRAGDVVEHLIQLSVVFILQTAVLPVAFLWLFLQLLKQLFRPGPSLRAI
jgi:hypothetical protein